MEMVPVLPFILLALMLIGIPVLGKIFLKNMTMNLKYEISSLEKERDELIAQIKSLEMEIAAISRPDRIKEIAKNVFQLREPKDGEVIVITFDEEGDEKE